MVWRRRRNSSRSCLMVKVSSRLALTVLAVCLAASGTGLAEAADGKFQLNGFQLAADAINKAGGAKVGGKSYEVELKVYDTRCNAAEGASVMQRLATIDKTPVVLGELCTPVAA